MCIGCIPIWHMYYTTFIHVYIIYSIYYSFPPYFIINYTQIMYTSTLLLLISTCYQYSYTLKMVKNTCITDLPYGVFYHIKILSLLIGDK